MIFNIQNAFLFMVFYSEPFAHIPRLDAVYRLGYFFFDTGNTFIYLLVNLFKSSPFSFLFRFAASYNVKGAMGEIYDVGVSVFILFNLIFVVGFIYFYEDVELG